MKGDAALFAENPRPRSVEPKIVNAVFARLWNLGEDSGDELENVEALAFGMRKQGLVMGAFALVEQCPGTGRPVNTREADGAAKQVSAESSAFAKASAGQVRALGCLEAKRWERCRRRNRYFETRGATLCVRRSRGLYS